MTITEQAAGGIVQGPGGGDSVPLRIWPGEHFYDRNGKRVFGLAFPDAPGFKGQGWSTQETAMVVRWLLADPAAWDRAMATARQYSQNPHTVADTLHETIVPRPELEAVARGGGDPARVNWLEIAHELIERRNDPRPALEHAGITAQALDLAAAPPVPDDPAAVAMTTAHLLDDTGRHLAHASARLDAARDATGPLAAHHMDHCARSLDGARTSAHGLAAHLRARYPAEGKELDALMGVLGLATSVSQDAETATTAHLVQTICNHLAHTIRHVQAMADDPAEKVRGFNGEHARTHLDGALEHVGKLTEHLKDNYPAEGGFLAGLGSAVADAEPESISEQANGIGRPKGGTITGQLDLSAASRAKAHATASATARATMEREMRDRRGRWARSPGTADLPPAPAAETPQESVTRFADRAAKIVPGLLGGGHQAWDGKVEVYDPKYQGFAAALQWDGVMAFGGELAAGMQQDAAGHGPVRDPGAYLTVLHELIHGTVPEGQSYSGGMQDYEDPVVTTVEEGFTELGAIHHAPEFFAKMGIGGRAAPGGGTMADRARQLADPGRIASGDSWGHYGWETAAAQGWATAAAAAEGKGQDRARELADEINREGPQGKMAALARQAIRAAGADPAGWSPDRIAAVGSAISGAWPDYPEGPAPDWDRQAWNAAGAAVTANTPGEGVASVAA